LIHFIGPRRERAGGSQLALGFLLGGSGVDVVDEQFLGGIAPVARLGQRDHRIGSDRQLLLLAANPVAHPPDLAAGRGDEQEQPPPSLTLYGLGWGFRFRHWVSVSMRCSLFVVPKSQQMIPANNAGCPRFGASSFEPSLRANPCRTRVSGLFEMFGDVRERPLKRPCGSPGWIRTSDHSINSRMLYR
jgi:hypothetical protein